MPSTAPTLTWTQTSPTSPTGPTVSQDALDAIATVVGVASRWEVKSSAANELEIGPIAASAIPNFRALIASSVDVAQALAPHIDPVVADILYVGIAPDGGALGNAHGSASPYGSARWSKYWKCSEDIKENGNQSIQNVHAIESDEVIAIFLQNTNAEDWWGLVVGAILDPPDNADGEGTPGRVYGMMVSGQDNISQSFWGGTSDFTASGGGNEDPQIGIFRPAAASTFSLLDRGDDSAGDITPRSQTEGGTRVTMPVGYYLASAPYNFIGILRQMRKAHDGRMRRVVQDGASVDQSFQCAGSSIADQDCLSFDNG